MKFRKLRLGAIALVVGLVVSGLAATGAQAATSFFQGFETDTTGWSNFGGTISQVPANDASTAYASGVPAATGVGFARLAVDTNVADTCVNGGGTQADLTGPYTTFGGYESSFPAGGYSTSVDVYLDTAYASNPANVDQRFDWSSAISDTSGHARRDFVFNVATEATGFVVAAGNNANRCGADPASAGNAVHVTTSGWYTFKHTFTDQGGQLVATLQLIQKSTGTIVHTWNLSDSTDQVGTTVGGHSYGWFAQNEIPGLAIDNSTLLPNSPIPPCAATSDSGIKTITLLSDCTTDHTIHIANGWTLDGNHFTITAVDPAGNHFLGAVIQGDAGAASTTIKNVGVTASGLADVCDGGVDRLRGILLDGTPGTVTGTNVHGVRQGHSGCQEGNAIEARFFPSSGAQRFAVTISNNTVSDYQKNGITTNGQVSAMISGNTVTGDGPISYIAQNGIQVGFGASATVKLDTASANFYSPASDIACGFLIYQASGVKASSNTFFNNERNQCNFGKGGGTFKPATP